jgi:V8-like Glu-specific endopeptidase
MWGPQDLASLRSAADTFDREAATKSVEKFLDDLKSSAGSLSALDQKEIFKQLRRARFFDLMQRAGEVLTQAGVATHHARRQHGQALIERGLLDDALVILEALVADPACPSDELAEAGGLIGRVHKQNYVDHFGVLGPARRPTLEASIRAYDSVYERDPAKRTWQGINAVAMILRGRRDRIVVDIGVDPKSAAQKILGTVASPNDHWDLATAAEACVALASLAAAPEAARLWDDAFRYLEKYVKHAELDAFSCASTLRQLRQVWQLTEDGPGGGLLTILQPAVMSPSPAGKGAVPERIGARLSLGVGELESAYASAQSRGEILEKVFGKHGPRSFEWYTRGLDRARAVARVEASDGSPVGTGFLVRAADVFKSFDKKSEELLLVTNSHVLSRTAPDALRAADAVVRFEALDNRRTFGVREILFESPEQKLDVTIASLDSAVTGVEPCPIAPRQEPTFDPNSARKLFVIGHPLGGQLSISIDDNLQVGWQKPRLHYTTPTEPGNSGSPVFDDSWRLLAVHHAGSDRMQRLDGRPGLYKANEGIWIHAVLDAITSEWEGSGEHRLESASPAVSPTFRTGIFLSYAHADAAWLERLQVHLKPMTKGASIEFWDDRRIQAGSNWRLEIQRQLDTAGVAILLVSADFLASDFIQGTEVPQILEASIKRGLQIVPIAVSASNYPRYPWLERLQFANDPKRPLDQMTHGEPAAALVKIAEGIGRVLDLARLSNPLRAMDALAFQATGLGGHAPAEAGLAGLGAQAVLVDKNVVLKRKGGATTVIAWPQINQLDDQSRQLVAAFDTSITRLYNRWTEEYPNRTARDQALRDRANRELSQIRSDLCQEFNSLLDFFNQTGWSLDDHYHSVRYICSQPPAAP